MKLLGSTKSMITKDENDEIITYLEITEGISIHCKNSCKQNPSLVEDIQNSRHLLLMNCLVSIIR